MLICTYLTWAVQACDDAHERLRGQSFQDGLIDLVFASDYPDGPLPNGPPRYVTKSYL
jgi:hypothetical protein